ncbi:MAG: hypothetical protein FJW21_00525 [Acidimicrobiia bacterium]|nr:hypothetical protein [Acidimicrobiia bacterium]
MRRWVALGGLLTMVGLLVPTMADAQTTSRRWQVEAFGGLSVFELPTSGDAALPPTGQTLPTSGPTNPSRRVPTWFLGDGASLLNGTNAEFGVASRLVPLDAALGRIGLTGSGAPVTGVRVKRTLTSRWSLEAGAEIHNGSVDIDRQLLDAVEQARAGFEQAFTGLFTSGPFTGVRVDASSDITGATSRELALTAAVRLALGDGHFAPYVTLGGGFIRRIGDLPRATLAGAYQFTVSTSQGQAQFAESDTLTIRYEQGTNLVGIAGAGFSQRLTDRMSLTIDGRAYLGQQTLTLRLDSAPMVTTRTPGVFIESFTTPAVQFSNNPASGRDSTLSGTPLNGFQAFTTSGLQVRYQVTAGVALRF